VKGDALKKGDYVRVCGDIVTDDPHALVADNDGTKDWNAGHQQVMKGQDSDQDDPARWTEIHPPDLIEKLPDPGRTVAIYGVALVARATGLDVSGKDESVTVTLPAPAGPPHLNIQVKVREFVGPETNLASISEGNPTKTGAQISVGSDSATVHVAVHGAPFGGLRGQFKAVYLLSWEDGPKK